MFLNGVLERVFGLKGEEVTGDWRELHEKEKRNLYSSSNAIRRMRLVGHAEYGRDQKYAQKFWFEILYGKGGPRHRLKDNIRINL
jgi:hypothetical protein